MKVDINELLKIKNNFKVHEDVASNCVIQRTSHEDAFVTITIPTYHNINNLKVAINSVLQQEEYDNYNILIVENNPTENISLNNIVPVYDNEGRDKRERISWYRNEKNIGMCGNWNRCIELCTSQYMVMLHTDDYLMPNYLKEVMQALSMRPKAAMIQTSRVENNKPQMKRAKLPLERFCLLDLIPFNGLCAPTGMLIRVDSAKALGGWNNDVTDYFDCYFNALFILKYSVYVLNKPLSYYRAHSDYPDEVKKNIAKAEYILDYCILRHFHIPQTFALARAYNYAHSYLEYSNINDSHIPYFKTDFSESQKTWSRRNEKYLRLLCNWFINIIEK